MGAAYPLVSLEDRKYRRPESPAWQPLHKAYSRLTRSLQLTGVIYTNALQYLEPVLNLCHDLDDTGEHETRV